MNEMRNGNPEGNLDGNLSEEERAFVDVHDYRQMLDEFEDKVGHIISKLRWDADALTDDEKNEYFTELIQNRDLIKRAFNHKMLEGLVLSEIEDLTRVHDYEEEVNNMETGQNRFVRFGLDVIADMRPDISNAMREHRLDDWKGLRAFSALIYTGTVQDKRVGVATLAQHLDLIEEGIQDDKLYSTYTGYLREILASGEQREVMAAVKALNTAVTVVDTKKLPLLVSSYFEESQNSGFLMLDGWRSVRTALERAGLPENEFVNAWLVSGKADKMQMPIYENLKVITDLEDKRPGATLFLYKEFGIMDFGRYPAEMLLKQDEEFNDTSKSYGVIMYPRNDWNGAFYADKNALEELFKSLNGEFSLRIVECDGKMDVAKSLVKLNRKYNPPDGSGHKIQLAIIGGHGTENSIRFGGEDDRHVLYTQDLMGKGTEKASQFFDDNPTIILVSCSTGADAGIGQELSKKIGAKVIAPKVPTNITALYASRNRGQERFRFNAKFADEKQRNTFVAGAVLQDTRGSK